MICGKDFTITLNSSNSSSVLISPVKCTFKIEMKIAWCEAFSKFYLSLVKSIFFLFFFYILKFIYLAASILLEEFTYFQNSFRAPLHEVKNWKLSKLPVGTTKLTFIKLNQLFILFFNDAEEFDEESQLFCTLRKLISSCALLLVVVNFEDAIKMLDLFKKGIC